MFLGKIKNRSDLEDGLLRDQNEESIEEILLRENSVLFS